jgi:uncharacterized membrane protein YfcA
MLNSYPVSILIGTALGILSGLGTGGGSLLILWLTLVLGMAQPEARAINLMFFIPSALVACFFRWRQGRLDIKKVLPAIIAGSIASGVFTFLSRDMDTALLQKLFGGLLLLTGIRELLYKPKKKIDN